MNIFTLYKPIYDLLEETYLLIICNVSGMNWMNTTLIPYSFTLPTGRRDFTMPTLICTTYA